MAGQEENTGLRYKNAIPITPNGCEIRSKFPLSIAEA
jgi:hypothetical protein